MKPFKPEEWRLKGMLVVIVVTAALASNFSLSLNTVSTYQLFKLLQTPILAVVEAATGFRAELRPAIGAEIRRLFPSLQDSDKPAPPDDWQAPASA